MRPFAGTRMPPHTLARRQEPGFHKAPGPTRLPQGGAAAAPLGRCLRGRCGRALFGHGPFAKLGWRGVGPAGAEFGESELPGICGKHDVDPDPSSAAYFAGKGMNLMRLPFGWERLQRGLNGQFDASKLAWLKSCQIPVTAAGATVLLDPHNYAR